MNWILGTLLMAVTAHATDYGGGEGRFVNTTQRVLYCFKDVEDDSPHLCVSALLPGRSCRADAIGTQPEDGRVFKIPNDTIYRCATSGASAIDCDAADTYSSLRTLAARLHNGDHLYGDMSWNHFLSAMGRDRFEACDPRWQQLEDLEPGTCGTSRDELAAGLTQAAEAIAPVGALASTMRGRGPTRGL